MINLKDKKKFATLYPYVFCIIMGIGLALFPACKNSMGKSNSDTIQKPAVVAPNLDSVDIAIKNGNIINGTGKPPYSATVYITGDRIVYIGDIANPDLKIGKTINAKDKIVTPGFIDLHAHGNPLKTPQFENFLAMGVTTIALGQDGSSPNTKDLNGYFEKINNKNLGVNIVQFVGHGTLRYLSGIDNKKDLSDKDIKRLTTKLKEQLPYCFGMSTGLEYSPGLNADKAELLALAKVVGSQDKLIMSHMRNEDDDALIASIKELAVQGKYAKVHISHLKSVYGKGADRAHEILDTIKKIRASGVDLTADMYPYTASYTGIGIVFPDWAKTAEQFALAKKNRRAELEDFIRKKVNSRNGPEATLLGTAPYTGKTLAEAATAKNKPFEKFLIEDLGPQGASGAYFVMDKELQDTFLRDSLVGICSDGSPTGFHPRGHGTFAKIIEDYVVKKSLLTLEEAIYKMTGQAAKILQLDNRGTLTAGNKADILIFDPKKVKATADYVNPHQLAKGFDVVLVNGKVVRENGELAEGLSGEVLYPKN